MDSFSFNVKNVLGQLNDTMKEVRPQTERERQLELQLACIVRRLQSSTVQAMEKQKKMEEDYRQAVEKLELDQHEMNKTRREEIFQNAENAKQKLYELKQQRRKEQAMRYECLTACERVWRTQIGNALTELDTAKKSQEDASCRIQTLNDESRSEVSKYKNAIGIQMESKNKINSTLDETVKKALDRENKVYDELYMSEKRKDKWERDLHESSEGTSTFRIDVRQSVARQNQFQSLANGIRMYVEQAKNVANCAVLAVQNELALVQNQGKVLQQDLNMSSERIGKLKREILQVDKRGQWLDTLKSTCGEDSSAYELYRQTSAEGSLLKEQLQRVLQNEQELFKRLQQTHENEKRSKTALEMTYERLKNIQQKIDHKWKAFKQIEQTCPIYENEDNLQKCLKEACVREQRGQEEIKRALSKEKLLQEKLRQVSEKEEIFHIPLKQLKYSQSGECPLQNNSSKHLVQQVCVVVS